ncbi:MAG: SAM-dependent methyltransferase [Cyanobacteria bacterium K_DeepCast_150m_m2_101]|nr:SAM-dependent methyltransferase [Cyanobacteria bacterium K_DeepCast_150m_m2_101]
MRSPDPAFSTRVERCFRGGAATYQSNASLQAAVAARLARLARPLASALPPGPRADLGAGSGLLARAIEAQLGGPSLLRLDACEALLAQESSPEPALQRLWDLNAGLPEELNGSSLLASSFALQWLEQPAQQLTRWCAALRPDGALLLAVPCRGSFRIWHQAAAAAGVPCTALPLPDALELQERAASALHLHHSQLLRFSRPNRGARPFLHQIKAIGAQASPAARLQPGALRQLIRHWPGPEHAIVWHVLVMVGQKR